MTDTSGTGAAAGTTDTANTGTQTGTQTQTGAQGDQGNGQSSSNAQSTNTNGTQSSGGSNDQSSGSSTSQKQSEPDAAAMRAYLDEKTSDAKTPEGKAKLDGKTPAEIADMYKALKGTETNTTDTSKPAFKVPDEFKDKPWAAKVTSEAELWKALAGAQELIGKKSIIPDLKTATPEQKEEFYKAMRPADVSEYVFNGDMASPDVKTAVGKILMDNGISAVQGNAVIDAYMKVGETEQAKLFDPEGFKTAMKATFGDGWEAVRDGVHRNLQGVMTKDDYTLMEKNLPNAYVNLIYRTLGNTQKAVENMMKRYGVKETSIAHFVDKTAVGGTDVVSQRAAIRSEMATLAKGPHTADQIGELRAKLAKTYENDPRINQQG